MSMTTVARHPIGIPVSTAVKTDEPEAQSTSSAPATTVAQPIPAVQAPAPSALRRQLADRQDWRNLANQLRGIDTRTDGKPVTPEQVSSRLNNSRLALDKDSTYAKTHTTPQTLATVITGLGFELPRTAEEVTALAQKLEQKAAAHPLGNLGGALSWQIPMTEQDKQKIHQFMLSSNTGLSGLPLTEVDKGTLGYLLNGSSVTQSDLQTPGVALYKLLDSPRAQQLGRALQAHLGGVFSDRSVYDYILAAIHTLLDVRSISGQVNNILADFDFAGAEQWGQSPSSVTEKFSAHLIQKNRATPNNVKLVTHLLLSRAAPQLLITDIPPSVKFGSALWIQLSIAAAKIEAHTPGQVPGMTYAQVLIAAESLPTDSYAVQLAQRDALILWGLTHNLLDRDNSEPAPAQIEQVREAYNNHLKTLMNISSSMQVPIPIRTEMALNCLKAEFPNVDPQVFEAPVLAKRYTGDGRAPSGDPRMRSMLDILLEGERLGAKYAWITNDKRIPITAFNRFARTQNCKVTENFEKLYAKAITAQKEGHYGMVKHLICELPLEDRKNLEFGKLEYFYSDDYRKTGGGRLELVKRDRTLYVKTTRGGVENLYHINTSTGSIEKKTSKYQTFPA